MNVGTTSIVLGFHSRFNFSHRKFATVITAERRVPLSGWLKKGTTRNAAFAVTFLGSEGRSR
jgi:hypothetical protein